jgi:hypothetical protein
LDDDGNSWCPGGFNYAPLAVVCFGLAVARDTERVYIKGNEKFQFDISRIRRQLSVQQGPFVPLLTANDEYGVSPGLSIRKNILLSLHQKFI